MSEQQSSLQASKKRVKRLDQAFSNVSISDKPSDAKRTKKEKKEATKSSKEDKELNEVSEFVSSSFVATTSSNKSSSSSGEIVRMTPHEHALRRPDMFVGNIEFVEEAVWTLVENKDLSPSVSATNSDEENEDDECGDEGEEKEKQEKSEGVVDYKICKKVIKSNDGLIRVFVEVLSNSIDNIRRSQEASITPKFIKVYISSDKLSVWNDGKNISTALHATEKVPIPELIFGNMFTSSNYNDEEDRLTSGRNGLGVKVQIFLFL
jgi:DNA topoisomerase-2